MWDLLGAWMARLRDVRNWQKRRWNFQRRNLRRVVELSGILIGTSGGRLSAVMCRKIAPMIHGVQDFVPMELYVGPMPEVEQYSLKVPMERVGVSYRTLEPSGIIGRSNRTKSRDDFHEAECLRRVECR